MGRAVAKVVVVVITFAVVADAAQQVAGIVSGTPTNELNVLMRKAGTARELAANLGSAVGCRLLTAHSEWILFVYLPVACLVTSLVARAVGVSNPLALGVISVLAMSRIMLLAMTGRITADLASVCGSDIRGAGASLTEALIAFLLCVLLAGAILRWKRGRIPF